MANRPDLSLFGPIVFSSLLKILPICNSKKSRKTLYFLLRMVSELLIKRLTNDKQGKQILYPRGSCSFTKW